MPRLRPGLVKLMLVPVVASLLLACGGGGGGGGGGSSTPKDKGFRVLEASPFDNEHAVPRDAFVTATFSDELDLATISGVSFEVSQAYTGHRVTGTLTIDDDLKTVRLVPGERFALNTQYRVLATTDIQNRFGERMRKDYEAFFFTVVTETDPGEPPPPDPKGKLIPVGAMWEGRSSHTSTLLSTGAVLVTGGWSSSTTITGSAELFDPLTRTFSQLTSSLRSKRASHTATLLIDGRVLVTGGLTENGNVVLASAEIYDPGQQTFTIIGDMNSRRCYHQATRLADGRVLITGGAQLNASSNLTSIRSAEVFDPTTNTFSSLPNMAVYRSEHVQTPLEDGKVLITGGSTTSKVAELFDPSKDSFGTTGNEMLAARRGHSATRMFGGTVLIVGGGDRSGSIYTPTTSKFASTPGVPLQDRTSHTADIIRNGRVLITGGYEFSPAWLFHSTMEYFNGPPGQKTFVPAEQLLSYPRALHRSTVLKSGDILLSGGANLDPTGLELNTAELYTYVQ